MNFKNDESVSRYEIHHEASEDLIKLFEEEFEDLDSLKIALDGLFQARVDNELEWEIMLDLDMPLPPNVSNCDGKQTELVHELVAKNEDEMLSDIKLDSQSKFLYKVLKELSDDRFVDVVVLQVIDSIRGLVDVLNEYESEHLKGEAVQSELDNLMDVMDRVWEHGLFYEEEDEDEEEEEEDEEN